MIKSHLLFLLYEILQKLSAYRKHVSRGCRAPLQENISERQQSSIDPGSDYSDQELNESINDFNLDVETTEQTVISQQ